MTRKHESGAVSLVVVIFASLLITVVTISFTRVMLESVQEASTVDLSQSAYDTALNGVEDAKRAIANGDISSTTTQCNQGLLPGGGSGMEVMVSQDASDEKLSQAYTCVTVDFSAQSVNYDAVTENSSILIPLKPDTGGVFSQVRIGWSRPNKSNNPPVLAANSSKLPADGTWPGERPALLRVRYIWSDSSVDMAKFNSVEDGKFKQADNSRTLFLVPANSPAVQTSSDIGAKSANSSSPVYVDCKSAATVNSGRDDCAFNLTNIPGASQSDAPKFVQITPLYSSSNISVEMLNGSGAIVPFVGVQAVVDSTGRASDLFRRVQARVNLDGSTNQSYPSDALVIKDGNLCKAFTISNENSDPDTGCR
jgi:hypothetical protein